MIEGVVVSPRRQLVDERGKIVHVLREDDPEFERFGEVYFSWVNPGVVKAWHLHTAMTLNYTCPVGLVKLALWDDREGSPSRGEVMELFLGPDDHRLVTVPPGVWNGFKGVATTPSMVCNCATLPHDPEEIRRRDPFDPAVPYDWALRHG
jgi:dTDP-4-dehydrorhamnose 3,5-epimerase